MTKTQLRNEFNEKAQAIGCKARLTGNGKTPAFAEFMYIDSKWFEIIIGIDSNRFSQLISKHQQLQG